MVNEPNPNLERYRATRRVTLVGAAVNILLSALQITFGLIGQSQALLADGIHTLSDLASDALILVAARFSHRDADESHPYGHGRYETLATVGLALALLAVAGTLAWDAGERLFHPHELLQPTPWAFWAALIGILAKESLYRYTRHVARGIRSKMLEANAWHHRSDAISSIVVVVGVGGTLVGLPYLDAIAAIGVAVMIAKIGWQLAYASVQELTDAGLDQERVREITGCIRSVPGVQDLHFLRTRQLGSDALVDVHILVEPHLTVSEGHHISERVRGKVIQSFDEISDVLVHIDPEDDEREAPSQSLPPREALIKKLKEQWRGLDAAHSIEKISFHYVEGQVHIDIVLPLSVLDDGPRPAKSLQQAFRNSIRDLPGIGEVQLLFRV